MSAAETWNPDYSTLSGAQAQEQRGVECVLVNLTAAKVWGKKDKIGGIFFSLKVNNIELVDRFCIIYTENKKKIIFAFSCSSENHTSYKCYLYRRIDLYLQVNEIA